MNCYTWVGLVPIKTDTSPVFVLAFPAPQEAHREPALVKATAGGEWETWTPLWILCPVEGEVWRFFLKGQSHLSLLFSVSRGLFREKKTAEEIKSERESEKARKHAFLSGICLWILWMFLIWAIVLKAVLCFVKAFDEVSFKQQLCLVSPSEFTTLGTKSFLFLHRSAFSAVNTTLPTPYVCTSPVNLHQYLIIWTAGLNNDLRIYGTSEQRLWALILQPVLQPALSDIEKLRLLWWVSIMSWISIWKPDMLQSCRSRHQFEQRIHTLGIKQRVHIHSTASLQCFICEYHLLSSTAVFPYCYNNRI